MTSKQVSEDNEKMSDTMYKLLKKYQAIRSIVKILHVSIDNLLSTKMFGKKLKKSDFEMRNKIYVPRVAIFAA